jgi:hypothetical protein
VAIQEKGRAGEKGWPCRPSPEAGEKQPALQSLVVALGSADIICRAVGESWLAVRRATGERRPEEKGQAGEKHRPGRRWVARVEAVTVAGRGGGGWPGLKQRSWQAGAAVVGYGRREDRERGIWGRMGVGGGDPCCFGPSAGCRGEIFGRVRPSRVEKLDLSFSTGHD